jgi:hypothetical protein
LGLTSGLAVIAAIVRFAPSLRRAGVGVPDLPHPIQTAVLLVVGVFLTGQVILLALAICTVGRPSHERFVNLMQHWPYVLVAPYVIIKRRALPDRYFSSSGQHRIGGPSERTPVAEQANSPSLTPQVSRIPATG